MTREEKKKAIDALKISAPVMVVTQEKFNDYIQTLNKVMNWLEQEPCEDASVAISHEGDLISRSRALKLFTWTNTKEDIWYGLKQLPSVAIPNKTDLRQALYEIRETIDDWWDKRIITNHTVYKMLRKLVEEKMYRD